MAENQRRPPSTRSPLAGCSIVIIGICAMAFLVLFVVWNLFKLDKEIAKFTTGEPRPTPVPDLVERIAEYNDLKSRLELFKDADGEERNASLTLSAEDINLAIASFDEFAELRKTFSVTRIEDGKLHAAISFPLRGKPFSSEMRYLNGTMIAKPILAGDEIVLEIEDILVPEAQVPEGFIGQMSPYRITQRYMDDTVLGPWMKHLTSVAVEEDSLVLGVVAAEAKREELPKDLRPYRNRFLLVSVGTALGLALVGGLIALLVRNRRKAHPTGSPPPPEQL